MYKSVVVMALLSLFLTPGLIWAHNYQINGYQLRLDVFQDHTDKPYIRGRVKGPRCRDLKVAAFVVGSAGDRVWIGARVKKAGSTGRIVYGEYGARLADQKWEIDRVNVQCLYR